MCRHAAAHYPSVLACEENEGIEIKTDGGSKEFKSQLLSEFQPSGIIQQHVPKKWTSMAKY